MHARTVVYYSVVIMQTLPSAPSVAMIGTRGKRMVEMIIMLMKRTSPVRSEARRRRLTEGLHEGGVAFFNHSSTQKMVHNTKGGPTLALA
jgi:hypothetical protein